MSIRRKLKRDSFKKKFKARKHISFKMNYYRKHHGNQIYGSD